MVGDEKQAGCDLGSLFAEGSGWQIVPFVGEMPQCLAAVIGAVGGAVVFAAFEFGPFHTISVFLMFNGCRASGCSVNQVTLPCDGKGVKVFIYINVNCSKNTVHSTNPFLLPPDTR